MTSSETKFVRRSSCGNLPTTPAQHTLIKNNHPSARTSSTSPTAATPTPAPSVPSTPIEIHAITTDTHSTTNKTNHSETKRNHNNNNNNSNGPGGSTSKNTPKKNTEKAPETPVRGTTSSHVPFGTPRKDLRRVVLAYVATAFDKLVSPDPTPQRAPSDGGIGAIPTRVYLDRVSQLTGIEPGSCVAALVYVERLVARLPKGSLTVRNAKRILLAAVLVASKVHSDRPFTNRYWAEASGTFTLEDVNAMERELCGVLAFDFAVDSDEYERHERTAYAAVP